MYGKEQRKEKQTVLDDEYHGVFTHQQLLLYGAADSLKAYLESVFRVNIG